MKKSIEFAESVLKNKISKVEPDFCELKGKITRVEEDLKYTSTEDKENIHNKLVELEDRSRQNNIRIDGVKKDSKESWVECERRVHSMLNERLDIENVEIERVHREHPQLCH